MQISLIYLLLFSIIMSVLTFYIGFVRPPRVLAWLSQAAFLMWLFFLIPVLGYVLFQQNGAIERLESTGFATHPAITESVGIANGVGSNPTWLFKIEGDLRQIMDFYRSDDSHPGWEMKGGNDKVMIFEKGNEQMAVAARKGWSDSSIMFSLSKVQNAGRRTQDTE